MDNIIKRYGYKLYSFPQYALMILNNWIKITIREVLTIMVTESFKDKIIRTFGVRGVEWVDRLPELLNTCIDKWNLVECIPSNLLSYNFICFAKSPEFGDVVLKIGVDIKELSAEIDALYQYGGRHICKCYDYDLELGAFIIERVIPGTDLTSLIDVSTRIEVAADLIYKLPVSVEHNERFPSYADWIRRAFNGARKESKVDDKMLHFIEEAESYFDELHRSDIPKVLLHGDLHHFNILQGSDGSWKTIDPKGIMGVSYFECGAFMENQLNMVPEEKKFHCLQEMVNAFSDKFHESKLTIAKAFFISTVLRTCWTYEEKPGSEKIFECVGLCEFIRNYIMLLKDNIAE